MMCAAGTRAVGCWGAAGEGVAAEGVRAVGGRADGLGRCRDQRPLN